MAIVDLEEEWSMLTNIVGPQADEIEIGTAVRVDWRTLDDGTVLPVFIPEVGR